MSAIGKLIERLRAHVTDWIDSVAESVVRVQDSVRTIRDVRLAEQPDGSVTLAGSGARAWFRDNTLVDETGAPRHDELLRARVSLILDPKHFVFRDLELPAKASGFMQGVVRAQLDRLTPWAPGQAAFGFSQRPATDPDRVSVTVAATGRGLVDRFIASLCKGDPYSIVVLVAPPGGGAPIEIDEHRAESARSRARTRNWLLGAAAGAFAFACLSLAGSSLASAYLATQLEELQGQIASARQTLLAGPTAVGTAGTLYRRKAQTPLATLVIETLSRVLPTDIYLTELEIQADTLRMAGLAKDAPTVIRIMEKSPAFSRVTFSAPTVRSASGGGERFQIEAHLNLVAGFDK